MSRSSVWPLWGAQGTQSSDGRKHFGEQIGLQGCQGHPWTPPLTRTQVPGRHLVYRVQGLMSLITLTIRRGQQSSEAKAIISPNNTNKSKWNSNLTVARPNFPCGPVAWPWLDNNTFVTLTLVQLSASLQSPQSPFFLAPVTDSRTLYSISPSNGLPAGGPLSTFVFRLPT